MTDNFPILEQRLDFLDSSDRYILHILRRKKDGNQESSTLIKTYYIDSIDYLKKKEGLIKEICDRFGARAYICVQPKNNFECLLNLGQKILEEIGKKNYSLKPDRLLREAYCGYHKSRKKQWILDLDNDNMNGWTLEGVKEFVKNMLVKAGKTENDFYVLPTKNGYHIITAPFNLKEAAETGPEMLYEGMKNGITGWLHKDGMTPAYIAD